VAHNELVHVIDRIGQGIFAFVDEMVVRLPAGGDRTTTVGPALGAGLQKLPAAIHKRKGEVMAILLHAARLQDQLDKED
jgi:hypothetical protein